jgi:protein ImuB
MQWIALRWLPDAPADLSPEVLGWWALQFTPRVAWLDEALVIEVSACERLWGGQQSLMRLMSAWNPAPSTRIQKVQGATSLIALARLRMFAREETPPADMLADLPLHTLTVARPHLELLERMGCRTWGDVAALPRGGLTRRFGAALREALDMAWGQRPERHTWLTLPDMFEQKLELPALAETAPELMWSANRLLVALQIWLRARQRGVLALELEWTLDLKRFNGVNLPPHQSVTVRTGEPTQDMTHLRRLLGERLAITQLAAPASWLRLRSIETTPWAGASTSFLPEDNRKGDKLHELVERLSARLGVQQVLVSQSQAGHQPERMQTWKAALRNTHKALPLRGKAAQAAVSQPDAVFPAWLLREPLRLELRSGRLWYDGALRLLHGPQSLDGGWWVDEARNEEGGQPCFRNYYIAEKPDANLLWIFCERETNGLSRHEVRWFLQGLYA